VPRHLSFSTVLIALFALPAWAGEPAPSPTPFKIQVQALQPGAELTPFEKNPAYETHAAPSPRPALASPRERERLLAKSGLAPSLEGWDSVDRDVLFMRAQSLDWDKLHAHYPKLPADALRSFQKLVRP
jgi:hypothetical protein